MCVHVCVYMCTETHTHTHTQQHTYTNTNTRTHTRIIHSRTHTHPPTHPHTSTKAYSAKWNEPSVLALDCAHALYKRSSLSQPAALPCRKPPPLFPLPVYIYMCVGMHVCVYRRDLDCEQEQVIKAQNHAAVLFMVPTSYTYASIHTHISTHKDRRDLGGEQEQGIKAQTLIAMLTHAAFEPSNLTGSMSMRGYVCSFCLCACEVV